jgi:hypothetical protein
MEEYKLINVRLFNPADRNVKQRCEYTYCNNFDNCSLYSQGKCVHDQRYFKYIKCPYGRYKDEEGYTKKSKSFRAWFDKKRKKYSCLIDFIEFAMEKLAVIDDYIYLPYPYLKNHMNSLDGVISEHFIKREDFTAEKIMFIVNFEPQALMGGTIGDFQNKYVPKFLQHLKEAIPGIYDEFIEAYPEEKERLIQLSSDYTGRTAYIHTLKVGSAVFSTDGDKFIYDGKNLICKNYKNFFIPFKAGSTALKIKVDEKMTATISDNSQVTENTIFTD